MERILIMVAFVVLVFLTQILSGLMGTIINLPFVALRLRGGLVDFVVSVITSIIILYLGIKAFAIFGHDKLLLGVPIVMIISYAVSLGYEKAGEDKSAIRYGFIHWSYYWYFLIQPYLGTYYSKTDHHMIDYKITIYVLKFIFATFIILKKFLIVSKRYQIIFMKLKTFRTQLKECQSQNDEFEEKNI
ncbi:MAG: hypothetical protein IPI53_11435 [Saprospiraceae bacterium]|nr:hypothetical protein [Saprospiraceae bacterium]